MRNVFWGFILVLFGTLLLLDNLGIADFSDMIHNYWPLILVLWGVSILIRRNRAQPAYEAPPAPGTTDAGTAQSPHYEGAPYPIDGDLIHQSEVFGDTDVVIRSQNFLGGSISSVFGDTRIDLSTITIATGEFTLRVHSVFGNVRIMLPPNAAIAISANSTFGDVSVLGQRKNGFSSFLVATTPTFTTADRRLKITISKVFGDLYVA
jgi:predicted membrane protein